MYRLCYIAFFLFIFLGCETNTPPSDKQSIAEKVAKIHGIDSFSQVEELQYTFHAKLLIDGETIEVKRSWVWRPQEKKISYQDDKEKVTYTRDKITEDLKKVDARFINDRYWLVYPFHLVWDDVEIKTEKTDKEGISKLRVEYPKEGGYTPGDVYELFVDENYNVQKWIYYASGAKEPTRVALWERMRQLGPITVGVDFPGPKPEEFRVWFTGVKMKLKGEDQWFSAE